MKLKFSVDPSISDQWQEALIECDTLEEGVGKYLLEHPIDLLQNLIRELIVETSHVQVDVTVANVHSNIEELVEAMLYKATLLEPGMGVQEDTLLVPLSFSTEDEEDLAGEESTPKQPFVSITNTVRGQQWW